mmetsp:Transcript_34756/g.95947  ORF Transcript_34756/g.95947 Transcript_34756/m.95947 type:complete len:227 (-) Transcript_34756:53-733(-)
MWGRLDEMIHGCLQRCLQATRDVWRWAEGALPAVHALLRGVAAEVGADTRGAWVSASVRFGRALAAFAASLHEMVATCGGAGHVCAEAVRGAESLLAASTQACASGVLAELKQADARMWPLLTPPTTADGKGTSEGASGGASEGGVSAAASSLGGGAGEGAASLEVARRALKVLCAHAPHTAHTGASPLTPHTPHATHTGAHRHSCPPLTSTRDRTRPHVTARDRA